ncbi:MAG: dTDP-4-dehydrorhamnose reductase [Solirubrobacterales bacterium]|nr:dTDP-4-dehydrorhamnose reductase [Solirubrobacterales bacterium]
MRLLVPGGAGMLAADVQRAAERAGHEPVLLTRAQLDITERSSIERALASSRPDAIVNCAAWTDVDGAEGDVEGAFAVNAHGAGKLARAAAAAGVPLLHVSSDYVFDGAPALARARVWGGGGGGGLRAYVESDPTNPLSAYGASKLAGEREALDASPTHVVVRSSWLFGVGGPNFLATMLSLAARQDVLSVVDDQVGCPTWTGHLAPALLGLLERGVTGLVHLAGSGWVSWNGLARELFRQAELDRRVEEIATAQMPRPAPRPAFSALESERAEVLPMPPWQDGVAGYLAARDGMMAR